MVVTIELINRQLDHMRYVELSGPPGNYYRELGAHEVNPLPTFLKWLSRVTLPRPIEVEYKQKPSDKGLQTWLRVY